MEVYLVKESYYDYAETWTTVVSAYTTLKRAQDEVDILTIEKGDDYTSFYVGVLEVLE